MGSPLPVNSLFIFNTTDNCFQVRNSASGLWENMYCLSGCTNVPSSPTANAASNVGEESFDANWSSTSGADNYYLDVDDNSDFSSPLAGYNNLNTGNVTTFNVSGLTCGTTYYYRVRASNNCGTSGNSNSITATYSGTCPVNCLGSPTTVVDVVGGGGKTWMDRNLGASQVATSATDALAYGDYYQWGRYADGHQCSTSSTTSTQSATDTPGHGNFILDSTVPYDWRSTINNSLWQGVNGTNNPCPSGYRLPTSSEFDTDRLTWSSNDITGAFNSPLKLTASGFRHAPNGTVIIGVSGMPSGFYWTSTAGNPYAQFLDTRSSGFTGINNGQRGMGHNVRCVKD